MYKPKLIIVDMDETLALPKSKEFYKVFGAKTVQSISERHGIDRERATVVAGFYREKFGGAEQALFRGDVASHFPGIVSKPPDYALLHDRLNEIDVAGEFLDRRSVAHHLRDLKGLGVKIVVLTSSPKTLAQKVLHESGFCLKDDFDKVYGYDRNSGPPKIVTGSRSFQNILEEFSCMASASISIGDSLKYDISPAREIGMHTCLISEVPIDGITSFKDITHVLIEIKKSYEKDGIHGFNC